MKIEGKIASVAVVKKEKEKKSILQRPDVVSGKTYKIKPPDEPAIYVTINDSENGSGRPIELFINSKNMNYYQWVAALTRVVSAIFRTTDNVDFLIDELKSVYDPNGGFWENKKYVPSVVAAIGNRIEQHVKGEKNVVSFNVSLTCSKCGGTMVVNGGCPTCSSCGDSKCS